MYKYGLITSNPQQLLSSCKSDKPSVHQLSVSYEQDFENNTSLDHQMIAEKNQEMMRKRAQLKKILQEPLDNQVDSFFNKMRNLDIQCQEIQSDGDDPLAAREISASKFQADHSSIQNPAVESQILQQQIIFNNKNEKSKYLKEEFKEMKKFVLLELKNTKKYLQSAVSLIVSKLPFALIGQEDSMKMIESDGFLDSQRSKTSRLQMQLEAMTSLYHGLMWERDQIKQKYAKLEKQLSQYASKEDQKLNKNKDKQLKIDSLKMKRMIRIQQQIDQIKPISSMKTIRIGQQSDTNENLTHELLELKQQLNSKKNQCNQLHEKLEKLQALSTPRDRRELKQSEKTKQLSQSLGTKNKIRQLQDQKSTYYKKYVETSQLLQQANEKIIVIEKQLKQKSLQNSKNIIQIRNLIQRNSVLEQIKFDFEQKQLNLDLFIEREVRNKLQLLNMQKKQATSNLQKNLQRKYTLSAVADLQESRNRQNSGHFKMSTVNHIQIRKSPQKISENFNSKQCSIASKNQIKTIQLIKKTTQPQVSPHNSPNFKAINQAPNKLNINYQLQKHSNPDVRSQLNKSRVSSTSIMKNEKNKRYQSPKQKQMGSKVSQALQVKLNKLQADINLELKNLKQNKV